MERDILADVNHPFIVQLNYGLFCCILVECLILFQCLQIHWVTLFFAQTIV